MTSFLVGLAAAVATLLGGWLAIHFKDRLHLILGFSAGAVIAVAFFDLLPEAIALSDQHHSVSLITSLVATGFMLYMILDRAVALLPGGIEGLATSPSRGRLGAGSLSIHSFLDGMAIGIAFQVSAPVGIVVATAVLVHDVSDGINTVSLILKDAGDTREAFRWLFLDAAAPVFGVSATYFFTLTGSELGMVLALFCGFFIYIGASDLLPESYHNHPKRLTTIMTLLGAGVMFVAIKLAVD